MPNGRAGPSCVDDDQQCGFRVGEGAVVRTPAVIDGGTCSRHAAWPPDLASYQQPQPLDAPVRPAVVPYGVSPAQRGQGTTGRGAGAATRCENHDQPAATSWSLFRDQKRAKPMQHAADARER